MEDFNIGAMKARNIAAQFGVIEKAETYDEEVMKARQVGDMHPNGKWVWTEYKPGRFDWRPLKGRGGVDRTPKKGDEDDSNGGNGGGDDKKPKKPETKQETGGEKHSSSDKKEGGKEKKTPTLDDYAKKTPTKTLENASKSPKAPGSVKGAAEAELKERKNKEIAKKLNLHSKGELATELTRIASEWDSYDDAQKTQTKQAIAQAHSTVLKNITSGNASDEAIAALADLTSIQNFFKEAASQPKQVGDIVKDLVSDLKAKNFNDTTAGKKEIDEISKKISNVSDGESLWFSFYGGKIQLKKKETLNNGFSTYTMYVNGVGIFSTIKPDDLVESMKKYYPDAKEIKGGETSSEYDAQKLEHLSEDELVDKNSSEYKKAFSAAKRWASEIDERGREVELSAIKENLEAAKKIAENKDGKWSRNDVIRAKNSIVSETARKDAFEDVEKELKKKTKSTDDTRSDDKVKLTEGSFKKGVVEKNEYTGKNAIDLHDYTGESIEYYTDNGEKKKAQPYISEFYNSAKQDAVGGYEAYFDRADSIGTFRTLKEAISALETWINNMRVKGHAKPEWIYNESRGRYQMNYRFN